MLASDWSVESASSTRMTNGKGFRLVYPFVGADGWTDGWMDGVDGRAARERGDDNPARLGLPVGVHDAAVLAAHVLVVPLPRLNNKTKQQNKQQIRHTFITGFAK